MKILHIVPAYYPEGPGGIEMYSRGLVAAQRRRGHEPLVLTGTWERRERCCIVEDAVEGARVLRLHRDDLYFDHHAKSYHPGVELLIGQVLDRERPDLVHVHQWVRLTCNLVELAERAGVPAVVTLHDYYASCPRCYRMHRDGKACFRSLSVESCRDCVPRFGHETEEELAEGIRLFADQYRAELELARLVFAPTADTARHLCAFTGLDPERVEVLPLSYSRRGLEPCPPPEAGEHLRLANWGRIAPHKGIDVLIEAFARALAGRPERRAELHLFGGIDPGGLEERLRGLAEGLPVHFHGPYALEQVAAARPHLGVFASVCIETHGYVLDECFELGLPCVLTDVGALHVRAGGAALVYPAGDVGALAERLGRVLDRPALCAELRARIPAFPPEPEAHAVLLEERYRRALAAPGRPSVAHPTPTRRAAFLQLQRESAQARICPEGGPR